MKRNAMKRLLLCILLFLALPVSAALTNAQYAVLKTAIAVETDPIFIQLRAAGATGAMADWYNTNAVPSFTVWKTYVSVTQIGANINGTELANMTTVNNTRLQTIAQFSPGGINPALLDQRQFFDDIFSGAGGVLTRGKLLILWKRLATRAEKLFATGTGSDAVPATMTFEGTVSNEDIVRALQ